METLTSNMTTMLEMAGTVITTILANPVLAFFFCAGVLGMVVGVVKKLKHV
jgi:hypothetical protein